MDRCCISEKTEALTMRMCSQCVQGRETQESGGDAPHPQGAWSPVALFTASAARASPRCPCLGPGASAEDAGRLSAVLCAASGSGFSFPSQR